MSAAFFRNLRLPSRALSVILTLSIAATSLTTMLPSTVLAGDSGRSTVDYIRVDPQDGVVRVKLDRKIQRPASCQTTTFMVIPLNDPNLQLFLASLYTATATKGALVRLFGAGNCTVLPGSETISKVTLFGP